MASRPQLTKSQLVDIFRRDGWLCVWCKRPVIFAPAMKYLLRELRSSGVDGELAYHHAHWTRANAPLLDLLGAVVDHVEAFSAGGGSEIDNLATACNKCNGRKSAAPMGKWNGRPIDKPIKGKYGEPQDWDGLSKLFVVLANRAPTGLTASEKSWLKALA
jgi:hypothetical protein